MRLKFVVSAFFVILFLDSHSFAATSLSETYQEGISNYQAGKYEEALDTFMKLYYKSSPSENDPVYEYYIGLTQKQLGNRNMAVYFFEKCVNRDKAVSDAYTELIDLYFQQGNIQKAEEIVRKAEEKGIKPAEVFFQKGLIFAKKGLKKEAIDSLSSAKNTDPKLSSAVDFQIAMVEMGSGNYESAKQALKNIIATDPTSTLADYARQYTEMLARSAEEQKAWNFSIGMGYLYDTNVILKPLDTAVSNGITGERDSAIINTLSAGYTKLFSGGYSLSAQYSLYSSRHSTQETYDVLSNSLSFIGSKNYEWGSANILAQGTYAWINDQEYLSALTFSPIFRIKLADNFYTDLSLGYTTKNYLQPPLAKTEDRDSKGMTYGFGIGWLPFSGKVFVNAKYEHSYENTVGDNWDYRGDRYYGVVSYSPIQQLRLQAYADIFKQKFDNKHTLFGVKRQDGIYTYGASLTWDIWKKLSITQSVSTTRGRSNIVVYDYKRNQYQTMLEYKF